MCIIRPPCLLVLSREPKYDKNGDVVNDVSRMPDKLSTRFSVITVKPLLLQLCSDIFEGTCIATFVANYCQPASET